MHQAWKAGSLNRTQRELLNGVPGFAGHILDRAWEKHVQNSEHGWKKKHCKENSGRDEWIYPREKSEDKEERRLAMWLRDTLRGQAEASGTKKHFDAQTRQKRLKALPVWRCDGRETHEGQSFKCAGKCGKYLGRDCFTDAELLQGARKKCIHCCQNVGRQRSDTQNCRGRCQKELPKEKFAARQWHRNEQVCKECALTEKSGGEKRKRSKNDNAGSSKRGKNGKS